MSGLGDVTFYNDDVTVGMVMKTVTLTDADPEDVVNLLLTIQSIDNGGATYFETVTNSCRLFFAVCKKEILYNYSLLMTCKIRFCRSIKTQIHWCKSL
jgi:hypothetical protein